MVLCGRTIKGVLAGRGMGGEAVASIKRQNLLIATFGEQMTTTFIPRGCKGYRDRYVSANDHTSIC